MKAAVFPAGDGDEASDEDVRVVRVVLLLRGFLGEGVVVLLVVDEVPVKVRAHARGSGLAGDEFEVYADLGVGEHEVLKILFHCLSDFGRFGRLLSP